MSNKRKCKCGTLLTSYNKETDCYCCQQKRKERHLQDSDESLQRKMRLTIGDRVNLSAFEYEGRLN